MLRVRLHVFIAGLAVSSNLSGQGILYVDDSAIGNGDGLSWCDAYVFLQDALAAALASGEPIAEIRVAQGTYKPDHGVSRALGDRMASFSLIDGVAIRGGYAGCGSSEPNERNVLLFQTILSGDLSGNDQPDNENCQENSYHVLMKTGGFVALDGLIIEGGNADGATDDLIRGAGLSNQGGEIYLENCTFRRNRIQATVLNAARGAAIYNESGKIVAHEVKFENNIGVGVGSPLFIGAVGVAVYELVPAASLYSRCLFASNKIINWGVGAGYFSESTGGSAGFRDTLFFRNSANGHGGGLAGLSTSNELENCLFIANNATFSGGAVFISNTSMQASNVAILSNQALQGGGLWAQQSSIRIVNTSVLGNHATIEDGGGISAQLSDFELANSIIWHNRNAHGEGENAQLFLAKNSTQEIEYSTIQSWSGALGGLKNTGADPLFAGGPSGTWTINATYHGNKGETLFVDGTASWKADELVGKLLNPNVSQSLQSSIVSNSATTVTVLGDLSTLGSAGAKYEIIDYRLSKGSPCIDAANNTAVLRDLLDLDSDGDTMERLPLDIDHNARFQDDPMSADTGLGSPPIVDMGAFEFQSSPQSVPTVSEFGLVLLVGLAVISGAVIFRRTT